MAIYKTTFIVDVETDEESKLNDIRKTIERLKEYETYADVPMDTVKDCNGDTLYIQKIKDLDSSGSRIDFMTIIEYLYYGYLITADQTVGCAQVLTADNTIKDVMKFVSVFSGYIHVCLKVGSLKVTSVEKESE